MNQLQTLTQINLDDLVASFGWQKQPWLAHPARALFYRPAQSFAKIILDFDKGILEDGLVKASRRTQTHFAQDLRVFGLDLIPDSAFLALSNHPGMSDTLSLFCALQRPDLKIIALERPFLKALPNTSKHLFFIKDDPVSRISLVRQVTSHLRAGGAALTFPAGQIEPDPDVYEGSLDSLQKWTDSAGAFIRMAPETAILPILVRGVIWDRTARHFLLGIKKAREERERLAAAFQLLAHVTLKKRAVRVRIQIGHPIHTKDLGTTDPTIIHRAVMTEIKYLIENPPQGNGISVLSLT